MPAEKAVFPTLFRAIGRGRWEVKDKWLERWERLNRTIRRIKPLKVLFEYRIRRCV